MPLIADFELLRAWRNGDARAGERLFARYANQIVRFFLGKVSEQIAQDLAQQTLLACVEGRDRIRNDAGFRSYLFGVANNLLCAHIRRGARAPVDASLAAIEDRGPTVVALIGGIEQHRALREALLRIPTDYQILYHLHYWEGLTGGQIAAIVDTPEGTVRTRLRRGRILLRKEMERIETARIVGGPSPSPRM